jgi:hypothetical protein
MWIMIITFLAYGDPAIGAVFAPAVTSVQFSSKETCEAAREQYLKDFKPIQEQMAKSIEGKMEAGQLNGPNGAIITAICVAG